MSQPIPTLEELQSRRPLQQPTYADQARLERVIAELREDEGIAEADTLLLTVPNMLGVDYNTHVIEAILKHVAPALGWR